MFSSLLNFIALLKKSEILALKFIYLLIYILLFYIKILKYSFYIYTYIIFSKLHKHFR